MRALITPIVAPLVLAILVVAGIIFLGREAEQSLRDSASSRIAFADLSCEPPAPLSRRDFLREVQYEADLPDELDVLDIQLPERLRSAFARHPWIKSVDRVTIQSEVVVVQLQFREPVLAV